MSLNRSSFAVVLFAVIFGAGLGGCRTSDKGVVLTRDSGAKDGPMDTSFREMAPMACSQTVVDKKANGERCECADQCGSGNCVDGVCCNSACTGTCQKCDLPGSAGMCSPVPAGMAPAIQGQCQAQDPSTCGLDGMCDGMGACRKYPDSTPCGGGTCQGSTVMGAKVCSAGVCTAGPSVVCSPYGCNPATGRCFDVCSDNSQCDGRECKDRSCGQKPLGAVCTAATECDSGNCADGVCCNVACTGACVSCNQAAMMGECAPVPVGSPDLHGVCIMEPLSTCGTSGLCNGLGGCARYAAGTECKASSCSAGSEIPMSVCDGNGTCLIGAPVSCAPFVCAGTACRVSCIGNEDCSAGNICVDGSCGKKPNGQRCAAASECVSNFCVDGVCCDSACGGTCVYCASPNARGRCTNVGAGAVDPRGMCQDRGASTCGTNGRCNGSRACQSYPNGTVCRGASCNAGTNQRTQQGTCSGGTCSTPAATTCAPYRCNGTACGNRCATNNDCVAPNTCQNGSCGKKPPGQICARADECASNVCAQGVCCSTACGGLCQACNLPGLAGTCSPVPAGGQDPGGRCAAQAPATCGRDGTCNGAGACRLHPATTMCAAASCSNGTATAASLCDGNGACTSGAARQCAPYVCNAATASCFSSCDGNGQCAPPNQCENSTCGRKGNGSSCNSGPECLSGNCVDGVCCNESCGGSCRSCAVAGSVGTCSNVTSGMPDPRGMCPMSQPESCGNDGTCNGSGGCKRWPSTTMCRSPSCPAGGPTFTMAAFCDGNGACPSSQSTMCAPYKCNAAGTVCAASCNGNDDCSGGSICLGGMCDQPKANGAMCSAGGECASGNCVQGVCCNMACGGSCRTCIKAGSVGTCSNVDAGDDDPAGMCMNETASNPCGQTGKCNGSGGCQLRASGTSCGTVCTGDQLEARTCNGSGTCGGTPMACPGFLKCQSNACPATCNADSDCIGRVCNTMTGACVQCTSDANCTAPQVCSMATNTCVDP